MQREEMKIYKKQISKEQRDVKKQRLSRNGLERKNNFSKLPHCITYKDKLCLKQNETYSLWKRDHCRKNP